MSALRLDGVRVSIGGTTILDGITMTVPEGGVVAIVGPNGAGKTTLLDVVSGSVRPSAGIVSTADGVGRVFQGSPLPATLTVAEIATLATRSRGAARALLDRFALAKHASSFVAELSTGMRRILDLAVATVGRPALLLLDEPSSGLAQSELEHLAQLVRAWRDDTGSAVLIVEHDVWLVKALADEVVVLEEGAITARGSVRSVLRARRSRARIGSPHDVQFREALRLISAGARDNPAPRRR